MAKVELTFVTSESKLMGMNQKQLATLQKNNEESRAFTRNCISFGLIALMKKDDVDYKSITVSKVCEVAGVSRAAFYRNFQSVDEVLDDRFKEFAFALTTKIGTDIYNNWLHVFKTADDHRLLLATAIKAGCEHEVLKVFLSMVPKNEESRTIQTIWLSIMYSLIIKWIKEGKPKRIEDMAKLAYKYTKDMPLVEKI